MAELRGEAARDEHSSPSASRQAGDVPFAERLGRARRAAEVDLHWDDPWAICYTGGTTGFPKGAVLTHRSVTANSVNTVMSWGLTRKMWRSCRCHCSTPAGSTSSPRRWCTWRHVDRLPPFDLDPTFDLIRDDAVTLLVGVPTMYVMMQQHPRWQETDFSRVKICGSGGRPARSR